MKSKIHETQKNNTIMSTKSILISVFATFMLLISSNFGNAQAKKPAAKSKPNIEIIQFHSVHRCMRRIIRNRQRNNKKRVHHRAGIR